TSAPDARPSGSARALAALRAGLRAARGEARRVFGMGGSVLAGELLRLRQKALGLACLGRVGADAAGLRAKAAFVVGAHRCAFGRKSRKQGNLRPWCRSKSSNAKALRKLAARGVEKWRAVRAPAKQCADNKNFENWPDVVPCSF